MNDMQCCASCQQWFTATPETCVVVKVRGHKERYYCGECIKNSKLSNRNEQRYEQAKCHLNSVYGITAAGVEQN